MQNTITHILCANARSVTTFNNNLRNFSECSVRLVPIILPQAIPYGCTADEKHFP